MKLEEKLFSLRKARGLSQLKLAEKIGISRQAVSRWETGEAVPSTENLKYLGEIYNVPLEYLLDDSKESSLRENSLIEETKNLERSKRRERKKTFALIVIATIGVLVIAGCLAVNFDIFEGEKSVFDLEEIPKEVMPTTESNFDFSW